MQNLKNQRAIVTGGSSGLGLGVVESRLGVVGAVGDVADRALATALLQEFRPTVLVLNAGAKPAMGPLHEQSWEGFSAPWNSDVKAGFHWIQEAIRLPLARGSRVLISSSGAAVSGSPLSGGYAGAKRMLWLMAGYANQAAEALALGIKFQTLVPLQMIGATELGRAGAEAYARRKGVPVETF